MPRTADDILNDASGDRGSHWQDQDTNMTVPAMNDAALRAETAADEAAASAAEAALAQEAVDGFMLPILPQRSLTGAAWRGGLASTKSAPAMRLPEVQDLSDVQSGMLGEQFLIEWLRNHGLPVEVEMYNSAYLDLTTAMAQLFDTHKARRIIFPRPPYYVRSPFPAADLRDVTLVSHTSGIEAPPTLVIENPLHTALSFGAASRDVRLEGVWSIKHLVKPDGTKYTANFDGCRNIHIETLVCRNVAAAVRFSNCDNIEIGTLVTEADTAISANSTATNVRIGRHIKIGAGANTVSGGQYVAIGAAGRGQWTPTATFATPGDLSVSYSNTDARWERIGRRLFIRGSITFTPTYTTASGALRIGGLPFPAAAGQDVFEIGLTAISAITWPSSATQMLLKIGGGLSYMDLIGFKSASAGNLASTGSFPSGAAYTIRFDGSYEVDA